MRRETILCMIVLQQIRERFTLEEFYQCADIQAEASGTIGVRPLFCDRDQLNRDGPPWMAGQGRQWIWISTVDRSRTVS